MSETLTNNVNLPIDVIVSYGFQINYTRQHHDSTNHHDANKSSKALFLHLSTFVNHRELQKSIETFSESNSVCPVARRHATCTWQAGSTHAQISYIILITTNITIILTITCLTTWRRAWQRLVQSSRQRVP